MQHHTCHSCLTAGYHVHCRLVADYEKWATSPDYRSRRAQQDSNADISSVQ